MSTIESTGTGEGLLAFLDWLYDKAEINPATARALKGSAMKVLELEGEPASVNMADLDVDQLLVRFENRYRAKYTSGSMGTYKSRFRQAVTMYLSWLAGDTTWRQVVKSKGVAGANRSKRATSDRVPSPKPEDARGSSAGAPELAPRGDPARLVTYDMPLRPDLIVRISLPVDLTPTDANRIAAFVRSLAFEDASAGSRREAGGNAQMEE